MYPGLQTQVSYAGGRSQVWSAVGSSHVGWQAVVFPTHCILASVQLQAETNKNAEKYISVLDRI
jgi:hypothetical protein